jgi:disulfide bond formation protein DsbB
MRWGALTMFASGAIVLTALGFEHIGGYVSCPLCLQQRYAYYAGIPLTALALVLLGAGRVRGARLVFVLVALGFLVNAGLGVHHAGIEWQWWGGPAACTGPLQPLGTMGGSLLNELAQTRVVRCDEATWQFAGLSFAGWNAVLSVLLALSALTAASKCRTSE